jgi:putative transposase
MQLVERHIIKKSNSEWKKIDDLCFLSKNLYNYSLYQIRQHFEKTGNFLYYNPLEKELRTNNQFDYRNLPAHTSQQILLVIDRNFRGYFQLLKKWKKNKRSLTGCPKPPKYKDKVKGRNLIIFTNQQVRIQKKTGCINFPKKTGLKPLNTKVTNLQQVRIIPQTGCYIIEVIYKKEIVNHENLKIENYLSIDLGVNNLASITTNQSGLNPILINGKIIKSINQYYNKTLAKLKSNLKKNHNKNSSNRTQRLNLKRNNKIIDYLHKSSKFIIDYCIEKNIQNIVIGKNKEWKQNCNIGKVNNQKFVSIPFQKLINQIQYKAELNSMNVILHEESYTSKCSALDLEPIKFHEKYIGKRVKRGLFKYSNGLVNADVNGSLNILRKVIKDDFINLLDRGFVHNPIKI